MSERIESNLGKEIAVADRLRIVMTEIEKLDNHAKLDSHDRLHYEDLHNEQSYLIGLRERGISSIDKDPEVALGTKVILKIKPLGLARGEKFPNMFVAITGYDESYTIRRRAPEIGPDVYELQQLTSQETGGTRHSYGQYGIVRRHNFRPLDNIPLLP